MGSAPEQTEHFYLRHIGPGEAETKAMLKAIGAGSLDQLMDETIPPAIRLKQRLDLPDGISEHAFLEAMKGLASKNEVFKSYIGMGYYDCITPPVIQRNLLENPGWYTPYTPYQAEVSQGRLEGLLNFQTMVSDLTGLEIANASLLDEGTAAAEAMSMCFDEANKRKAASRNVFLIDESCFPQTVEVLRSRALPHNIELRVQPAESFTFDKDVFGMLLQYPDGYGAIHDYHKLAEKAKSAGVPVVVSADLLSLTLLTPPGEWGADVVVGNTQRFGVPMGFGGPHAAYFATHSKYKRRVPGRIIGLSIDKHEKPACRMALQTREQHIRKERATSNICTAQALLANIAGMYAVYHGPHRLKQIAQRIHTLTCQLNYDLQKLGYTQKNKYFFDTLMLRTDKQAAIREAALKRGINFRYIGETGIGISLDETTDKQALTDILKVFAEATGKKLDKTNLKQQAEPRIPSGLQRKSDYLTHRVFNRHHSETQMMRYLKQLENKDLGLNRTMIPLGSCTMKLNAVTELMPLSWAEFNKLHPFVPADQAKGYTRLTEELSDMLQKLTGLPGCSLQPNSGAQGEFTGLMTIRAYHQDSGDTQRNVVLIPESAHGTNPASGVMAGMRVVTVKCDDQGNIDTADLRKKAEQHAETLSAIMITYPSTHGVFEENIQEICKIVHDNGGQVYLDGANMNAQVGYTTPAITGADVVHLNLHKTFSIPHGGGGPGMGPICVAEHLKAYLPGHPLIPTGGKQAIPAVNAAPWGSASILTISYAYLKLLGRDGLEKATQYAILNANYLKERLRKHYPVLYEGRKGRVAHEFIIDLRRFQRALDITVEDVAKRLIDYGFHAPTMSWPVPGTMMVEPTESEPKEELDRFCEAMAHIRQEIEAVERKQADAQDNVLKHAPHTAEEVTANEWAHPYPREQAAYPLSYVRENKFWSPVARVNNPYGDRHLVCTCPPLESYEEEAAV